MRTYKEPKRIDKPQARDSAIRQLNADASKFAAIRSAAISMQEEENEGSSSKNDTETGQHSTQNFSKNHVIPEQKEEDSAMDLSMSSSSVPPVEAASIPQPEAERDLPHEDNGVEDRLNSSYSSSSIPTDSVISSSSRSDLDLSFNSVEQNNSYSHQKEAEVTPVVESIKEDAFSSLPTKEEASAEHDTKESEQSENTPTPKKKTSPKQTKKQKTGDTTEGKAEKSSPKEKKQQSPKGVKKKQPVSKALKDVKKLAKKLTGKAEQLKQKVPKPRGRPRLAKGLKKGKGAKTDVMKEMKIDTDVQCETSAAVSPRSSKRTPKKNRKYDSDEGSSMRKSSPRAGKKRKLLFDMEDDEFEEALIEGFDVKDMEDVEGSGSPNTPPKKRKKQQKSVKEKDESEGDQDEGKQNLGNVKKKKKKPVKKKVDKHDDDSAETKDEQTDDVKVSTPKKKVIKRPRKIKTVDSKAVKEDTKDSAAAKEGEENEDKSDTSASKGETSTKSADTNSNPNVVKKRKYVRKKALKTQEPHTDSKEGDGMESDKEDGAMEGTDANADKKDQISISCPLCGHISHSKSANTRHIKRCVEIPKEEEEEKPTSAEDVEEVKAEDSDPTKEEKGEKEEEIFEGIMIEASESCNGEMNDDDQDLDVSLTKEEIFFLAKDFACDYSEISADFLNSSGDTKEDKETNREFPNDITDVIKKRDPNSLFMCEHCDYCTPKRAMLGRHLRIHGIFVCLRCNFICDSRIKLKEHVLDVHRDRADYKLCRKCCRYVKCAEYTIEQHMEMCEGPVPFKCPHCDKEFKYESSLKSHIIRHTPDAPKKFHCPNCEYESNYKANLKKHFKNIHGEKTESAFRCPFADCGKVFHTPDNLKRHFRFHSDERPHACTKCEKRFKTAAALRGHFVVHSPSRPFKCNINDCTKDFRSKKLLKNHMEEFHNLTDKKYACDYPGCDFAFFKRSHLERHKITHTGERKFGCNECGKAFRHSDNLKVHMRQHTNEKPVKCHLCSFACRQKSSLQYHLRKFHQISNPSRASSSEAQNLQAVVSAVFTSVDDGVPSSVSSESKENQDLLNDREEESKTEPFSPIKKSQNAMDLYEFRSDEEFDDDSVLKPLRQERTSTPLRPEKIFTHQNSLDGSSETSIYKHDAKSEEHQSSTVSEKTSGEIVESIKIEDIIIEEVVKFAENNDNEASFVKSEQNVEPEQTKTDIIPKPKKKPGRKKKNVKIEAGEEKGAEAETSTSNAVETIQKEEPPVKPKGKRGRKPKAKKLEEQEVKTEAKNKSEDNPPEKPPRKKPGPKPKKDKDKKDVSKPVKVPKKRGPKKKKKVVPVDDNTEEEQETPSPPRKKRKYTRRKTGKKPGRKPKVNKTVNEDSVEEEEETIIYSELDQNTAKEEEDDGEATEIEGFDEEEKKSPEISKENEEKEQEEKKAVSEEENAEEDAEEPTTAEKKSEDSEKGSDIGEPEASTKVEGEEKKSEEESERMSSGIDTDFEEDLKPPPAPRPPPVVDSDEGDIESGPEEMDTPGRDFESTPPKSVQNHSVQSLRDYESTPPKSVQPDSVPNYGSIENKNDVLSPEIKQPSSQQPLSQSYPEDRGDLSNPVPSNISYPPPGSVELPGSAQSVPQATPTNGPEYISQSDSTMPEVDKDYLGQYLQQFDSNRSEDESNRLSQSEERPPDHLNIPTSPQKELSSLNMNSPGAPPLNLSTSADRGEDIQIKGTDMSNKRMEILSIDRQHEEHFQSRSENPSRSSERIPDNVYDSISSMNSYLPSGSRETPTLFPPTSTSTPYMPFTEGDAILQRQRMPTPFLGQNDQNALQNLHRMADSALAPSSTSSLLRRPTTVPSREEIFPNPTAVAQSMARHPFHPSWSSQDVRHPHWSQAPYLQRPIDRQSGTTANPLFGKDNYLGRDFVFDTSRRSVTERNMFPGLAQSQRPELAHETFSGNERFDFSSYFGLPGYPGAPPLDYTRSTATTTQKSFDERYRQTASGMTDFRGLPQSTTSEMFRSMNSTFNFDKYMYTRDPMYHTQHIGESTNSPFLAHGVPTQHAMFDREYARGFYQNGPYSFMNDKPYAAAAAAASAKLSHSTTPGVGQDRDFAPRPNTAAAAAADSQMQDAYRHPMLYNMMNRYFE